jgi:hypothetical protein
MFVTFATKWMSQMTLVTNRKETCSICYRNTVLTVRPRQDCEKGLSINLKCNVQSHCWPPYITNSISSQTTCLRANNANDGRQCFGNFYFQSRQYITDGTERRRFACQVWKNNLEDIKIDTMFSPIRHPQGNQSEKCRREIYNFCSIYCQEAPEIWPQLLSHIEGWLNGML